MTPEEQAELLELIGRMSDDSYPERKQARLERAKAALLSENVMAELDAIRDEIDAEATTLTNDRVRFSELIGQYLKEA